METERPNVDDYVDIMYRRVGRISSRANTISTQFSKSGVNDRLRGSDGLRNRSERRRPPGQSRDGKVLLIGTSIVVKGYFYVYNQGNKGSSRSFPPEVKILGGGSIHRRLDCFPFVPQYVQ